MSIPDVDPRHKAPSSPWVQFFIQPLGGENGKKLHFHFWEKLTNVNFYIVVFTAQYLFSFALILCNQWRVWSLSSKMPWGPTLISASNLSLPTHAKYLEKKQFYFLLVQWKRRVTWNLYFALTNRVNVAPCWITQTSWVQNKQLISLKQI